MPNESELNLDPEPASTAKPRKLTKAQRTAEFILSNKGALKEATPRPAIGEEPTSDAGQKEADVTTDQATEVSITIPKRELNLQMRTLRAELKFHREIFPSAIENLSSAGMLATAALLEMYRTDHIDVLEQSIGGLSRFVNEGGT